MGSVVAPFRGSSPAESRRPACPAERPLRRCRQHGELTQRPLLLLEFELAPHSLLKLRRQASRSILYT